MPSIPGRDGSMSLPFGASHIGPLELCCVFRAGVALLDYHSEPRWAHWAVRNMSCIPGKGCSIRLPFEAGRTGPLEICCVFRSWVASLIYHSKPRGAHWAARNMSCIPNTGCSNSLPCGADRTGPLEVCCVFRAGVASLACHPEPRNMVRIPSKPCIIFL
jgi:hypothetical protein